MSTGLVTLTPSPLAHGCPPDWATLWAEDQCGPWVEFELSAADGAVVSQRLRWVPPGTFFMGSPATDKEVFDSERPQHLVTLRNGFWLFDTPCTQDLWLAVMGGENPSVFKGPHHPVERVSWEDAQAFVVKLNERVPGLGAALPTEAQWEYACRAGTSKATYGPLNEVAWHGDNSKGETHPVGEKSANRWGLFDMLGNVYEWCLDGQRNYTNEHQFDPIGPMTAGAYRVVRGGSWSDTAQYVRAAYRTAVHPGYRGSILGFRCLSSGRRAEQ